MSSYQKAIELAQAGFFVFPLIEGGKLPAIKEWQNLATRDAEQIKAWFTDPVMEWDNGSNIGIRTGIAGTSTHFLVVDVDNKGDKRGDDELERLAADGFDLPPTREHATPTGGRHLLYTADTPVGNSASKIASGVDIRGVGGFIVAPGSRVEAGEYRVLNERPVAKAPQWLIDRCSAPKEKTIVQGEPIAAVNQLTAAQRAIDYLASAPVSFEGQGGDDTAYRVAAKVKDFGVSESACVDLMLEHWNPRCEPPWDADELEEKVANAYAYGKDAPGVEAPEAQFEPVEVTAESNGKKHPLEALNDRYALVYLEGSHFVIEETVDHKGLPKRNFLTESTFKRKNCTQAFPQGNKTAPIGDVWLNWSGRREYEGICFCPEQDPKHGYYNLWTGFTVEPVKYEAASARAKKGFDMWMSHVKENVCDRNDHLYRWFIGYFAHMIQRPWERPLTTLVMRGSKGTGKNAVVDRIGKLVGRGHYLVAHDPRYLTSNFNGHMDSCLCLVLDEAFWGGDKSAEGKLKGLTTSPDILIERKGKEPYVVDNLVRLVVIGNEQYLVPATADERRWAVFDIADHRRQDRAFFAEMRQLMDSEGGGAILLDFLKSFDLSSIDINQIPDTQALLDQKIENLEPIQQWWFESISNERVEGGDFGGWPEEVEKVRLRDALYRWWDTHRIRSRRPSDISIGKALAKMAPSVKAMRPMRAGAYHHIYAMPSVEILQTEFEKFVGQEVKW